MATLTAATAAHATLTGTTVDTVTLTPTWGAISSIVVINTHATNDLWVRVGVGAPPTDPTASGNNTIRVRPNVARHVDISGMPGSVIVKLLGNANGYSVEALTVS